MSTIVIIPVFNRPHMIRDCLDGVARQTRQPAAVMVSDDGSTDGTAEVVERWIARQKNGRYALLRGERQGPCTARNVALAAAPAATYVAYLDSDDVWPEDFLERAERVLDADPRAIAATADIVVHRTQHTVARPLAGIERSPGMHIFRDAGVASASLFRRAPVERHGGFDPRYVYGHDSDLFLRLCREGAWRHLPGAPVVKREGVGAAGESARHCESGRNPDLSWAWAHERIVREQDLDALIPARRRKRVMAGRWYRAGRREWRAGRLQRACCCFRRALRWQPTHLAARRDLWRAGRSYIKEPCGPPSSS